MNMIVAKKDYISKSKYLEGIKCHKLLWYEFNNPDALEGPGAMTLAVFAEGRKVGALARTLYPEGIMLGGGYDHQKAHEKTILNIDKRKPLFEAALTYNKGYALADILNPAENDSWDLIEVKSSTEVKDEHIVDVAFQKYIYEGAGLKINKCYLMHINNRYVKHGPIEPEKLFKTEDITVAVSEFSPNITNELSRMIEVINLEKEPTVKVGPHCNKPHECPLEDHCWGDMPKDSLFTLYRGGKFLYDLYESGIEKIQDIPLGLKLTDKQLMQIKSHKEGKDHLDREAVKEFIDSLNYPLFFLDFETMAPAIPVYDGTRPYEAIPFQYSLHTIKKENAEPIHFSYIAPGDVDPRPEVLKRLKEQLGEHGTIIAYNANFELRTLKNSAELYTEYKPFTDKLDTRFADLMAPFTKFMFYTPEQSGSYSMKNVLPALTGKSYAGLGIANGEVAQREYMRVTFEPDVAKEDKEKVLSDLDKYCELDTLGMIYILDALKAKL